MKSKNKQARRRKRARQKSQSTPPAGMISPMRIVSFGGGQTCYDNLERMGLPLGVQKSSERVAKFLHPVAYSSKLKITTERMGAYYGHELGRARRLTDEDKATKKDLDHADRMFNMTKQILASNWSLSLSCGAQFIRGFSRALDYEARQPVGHWSLTKFTIALAKYCDTKAQEIIACIKANRGRVGYKVAEFILSQLPNQVATQARRQFQTNPKQFVRRLRKEFERLGFVPGKTRREAFCNR